MADSDLEDRVNKLETTVAFQEDTMGQLNEFITEQQVQLQALEAKYERMEKQLRRLAQEEHSPPDNEGPPPHY